MRARRIQLVTPAAPASRQGNRVTADRWAELLRALGHAVEVSEAYDPQAPCELLVALHATKSAPSVEACAADRPGVPIIVGLAGTDVYGELATRPERAQALARATRLVVLQPRAERVLPAEVHGKLRTIVQSASRAERPLVLAPERFTALVLAHLRPVKDPLLAARAARLLPARSRVLVLHAGAALDPELGQAASAEARDNPRYRWLGERAAAEARALVLGSQLLVVSSRSEGGANVISEALAAGTPVLASAVDGNIGLLGEDYGGYFPVEDAAALAAVLLRAEEEPAFLAALARAVAERREMVAPEREQSAWRALLEELWT